MNAHFEPSKTRHFAFVALALVTSACATLIGTDFEGRPRQTAATDAGDADLDHPDVDSRDGGENDGGDLPPPDTSCGEAWTLKTKNDPSCAKRTSVTLDSFDTLDAQRVSIAATSAGRVGIATDNTIDVDQSEMLLGHFVPDKPGFNVSLLRRRPTLALYKWGYRTKVVASGTDTLGVASFDVDATSDSGNIVFVEHAAGASSFTTPELVAESVGSVHAQLDAVSDGAGTVYVAFLAHTGPDAANVTARGRTPGGTFKAWGDIVTSLYLGATAPSTVGAVSLSLLPSGIPQALVHAAQGVNSTPAYATYAGPGWTGPCNLANEQNNGVFGRDPRTASQADTKFATYFGQEANQPAGSKQDVLTLATWQADCKAVTIETIDAIPASSNAHAAMAVDRFGLVHLVWTSPDTPQSCTLHYRRQVRDGKGTVSWLDDVIDDAAVTTASQATLIDIVVDIHARPHIAYITSDGHVHYATRYDR
ncbi:hypothetical protein AKJ09_05266 [Labilithrix luteola]|uniref:Uncharacterized protein n=1 Tax=Labilithrix luteola TaxID=1391654 RepID=A0A0K1PYM3_9BACT|nr:hypothetical protein [Labilithrix luteola]AKU98602.1 hypothetical protein AKJ09_05266 [Labilithrix luteola]